MSKAKKVGLIGGGVIGAGWAARLLLNGIDVVWYDPAAGVADRMAEVVANALRAYRKMTLASVAVRGQLTQADSIADAVRRVDFIQESGPERLDLKQQLLGEVAHHAPAETIIASSSSGLLPSDLQAEVAHPARVIVGHPFNPVYLMPLVEIVGGKKTSAAVKQQAAQFYRAIGMHPLVVRKEVAAFIADRLMEALWREALHLLNEEVATVDELDQAIIYGPGLRWAFMGPFLTFRIAGGAGGMRHFMEQFGPTLKWPWTRFDGPELTEALLDKIAAQSDIQAAGRSTIALEQMRDDCIVSIMQGLRANQTAAGVVLARYEEQLYQVAPATAATDPPLNQPLCLHRDTVHPHWLDYNHHMTESSYLQAMGDASDALFRFIGVDADYHAAGFSYFTRETHLRHVGALTTGRAFYVTTQLLGVDAKRLHIFHSLHAADDDTVASTAEQMLLHVDTQRGRSCPVQPAVLARLESLMAAHHHLARPPAAGQLSFTRP